MMAALTSSLESSSIYFLLVLASGDYLFSGVVIFLVLDGTHDFLLYPEHFGYYVKRLLILFKVF